MFSYLDIMRHNNRTVLKPESRPGSTGDSPCTRPSRPLVVTEVCVYSGKLKHGLILGQAATDLSIGSYAERKLVKIGALFVDFHTKALLSLSLEKMIYLE